MAKYKKESEQVSFRLNLDHFEDMKIAQHLRKLELQGHGAKSIWIKQILYDYLDDQRINKDMEREFSEIIERFWNHFPDTVGNKVASEMEVLKAELKDEVKLAVNQAVHEALVPLLTGMSIASALSPAHGMMVGVANGDYECNRNTIQSEKETSLEAK